MMGLAIAQVMKLSEDGRRERLLWLDVDGQGAWFIDIEDPRAMPIHRSGAEVEGLLAPPKIRGGRLGES